jgi:phosphatidylinositol-bisphosphatase
VFRFVPLDGGAPVAPDWLTIEPMAGLILPGNTLSIHLKALLDNAAAARLNLAPKALSETLILRTVNGKDHFVSLSAEYQYTCFANKLSRLVRLPKAIRDLDSPDEVLKEGDGVNAPRELMKLVNTLMSLNKESLKVGKAGLFSGTPDEELVRSIRECLDTGADFPPSLQLNSPDQHVAQAFATTLVEFLASLPESIVDPSIYARCAQVGSRDEAFELLDMLPPTSVNVWIAITAFLHFVRHQSDDPELEGQRIATIFAPLLLRDDDDELSSGAGTAGGGSMTPLAKRKLLLYFI